MYIKFLLITFLFATLILGACSLQYDTETQSCMITFSPNGEQIEALGNQCIAVIDRVRNSSSATDTVIMQSTEESP